MAEDQRGGLKGYQTLKRHVEQVLRGLRDGALFNVIAFEDSVSVLWKEMRPAGKKTRTEASDWVMRFNNVDGPFGLLGANYAPGRHGLPAVGGTSRLDLALTAAFELGSDTVFVITDGVPRIRKELTGRELEEYRKAAEAGASGPGGGATGTVSDQAIAAWEKRVEAWEREQQKRRDRGLGPQVREGGVVGPPPRPRPTGAHRRGRRPPWPMWGQDEVLEHIEKLQEEFYVGQGRPPAKVHVVGYEVTKGTRDFLRRLARAHKGRFRSIESFD
jgi:hypothetical protein